MSTAHFEQTAASSLPSGRSAGITLILASILSVASLANHPVAYARDPAQLVAEIGQKAAVDRLVHGSLIVFVGGLLYAFSCLTSRLGAASGWARAGFIAYAMGAIGMIGAASIDGFVIPDFVSRYDGRPAIELGVMKDVLGLCGVIIRVWTRLAFLAISIAFLLWSIELIRRPGMLRAVGMLGGVAGAVPMVALLTGVVPMNAHGVLILVAVQTIWSVAVGVQLIRGRI